MGTNASFNASIEGGGGGVGGELVLVQGDAVEGERKCRPGWWNPSYDTLAELSLVGDAVNAKLYCISVDER